MATQRTEKHELDSVRDLLRSLIEENRSDEAVDVAMSMLHQLQEHNSDLLLRLAQLRRERSGRRSEKIDPAQLAMMLELCGEDDGTEDEPSRDEGEAIDGADDGGTKPPGRRPRRRRPPKELPRDVICHELSSEERRCDTCGKEMPQIGNDVSEVIELVPAHFRVEEHRRAKYACPGCKETVKTAAGPSKLIEKGLPGPGLLTHVMVSKYQEHTPLHRLSRIYDRSGVDISVSTMCGWVRAVAEQVKPIVDRMWERILSSYVVQTDASGLKVLDRDHSEGIRRGTMWCYVGDRQHVVFRFSQTGSGEDGPWRHLKDREGYIQADAASVFDRLYDGQCARATEVGCLVHARRKFFKLQDSDPRVAYPLDLISKVYKVERAANARGLSPKERLDLRKRRSSGLMQRLKRWIVKTASREPPQNAMRKACDYSLNHWEALTRFLGDGALAPDNNLCELQIRSLAIGRRNYLFAGSDAGAEHAANLYSIMRTCAVQNVDAYAYLMDIIGKLADGWPATRIDELLPAEWAAARAKPEADASDDHDLQSALQVAG